MSLQIRRAACRCRRRHRDRHRQRNLGDSYPSVELHDFLQAHYSSEPQRTELSDPRSAIGC